jgi:hypothetical protein
LPRLAVAAVLLVAGAALAPLAAQPVPEWFADEDAAPVRARWGIPGMDAVGFEVLCAAPGRVAIRPALFAMSEPAELQQIRFDIDGDRYERNATLAFSERDGAFQATAVVSREDPLIDALRRGSDVTYDFLPRLREGDEFTVSLSGSAKAIDAALEGC